jgi:hypothetical protein
MTDPWGEPARPEPDARCPWCSAALKNNPARCPSCGASLHEDPSAEIPGVTQLDPAAGAVARPAPRSRSLLGWLSGEYEPSEGAGERESVSPPSDEVRAEMARLEMEAIQAEIEAAAAVETAERNGAAQATEVAEPAEAAEAAEPAPTPPNESSAPPA